VLDAQGRHWTMTQADREQALRDAQSVANRGCDVQSAPDRFRRC
jgi:hypothetical protein